MSKITKLKQAKSKTKLNGVANSKIKKTKINGKFKKIKGKPTSKSKVHDGEDLESGPIIKKKPSKADLKLVLENLKKDPNLAVVRKALKYVPFYLKSEGLTKKLVKEVIRLWAEAGEKIRVICLLCLIRIFTKLKEEERKHLIIKKLYASFMEKCRITKHETMSMIGFMRHSLIELFKLSPGIAFKQAQSTCQQLAVTLKNAQGHKNEATQKTVLNWQFSNCLILLSSLIASHKDDKMIKTLTNQVINLNLDAINLIASPRYYPYYCHLLENLISISIAMNTFIPILPILLRILDKISMPHKKDSEKVNGKPNNAKGKETGGSESSGSVNDDSEGNDHEDDDDDDDMSISDMFDEKKNKKSPNKKEDKKEFNMDLLNHVSLEEAHSLEYQKAVLIKVHELVLKYLASQCHRIAFPELVLLPRVQIRKWLRRNRSPECLKFGTLLEKIKSDCDKIENSRLSVDFEFSNYPAVDAWEKRMRDSGKLSLSKMLNAN